MKDLTSGQIIADRILKELSKHFIKYTVCGSIRRKKEFVKDIDIVAIPKPESEYQFGEYSLTSDIERMVPLGFKQKSDPKMFLNGPKIKRFYQHGFMIDLYLADESTYETLILIRTGSTEHNIRLTKLARQKGLKLFASGKGLCEVNDKDEIIRVVENTESGILQNLVGRVPLPEERRV